MIRPREDFDIEEGFVRRDERLDFDIVKAVEKLSDVDIYTSVGGIVSEEFSPEEPPPEVPISLPPEASIFFPPEDAEYITGQASALKMDVPSGLIEKMAPTRNFLDMFFDWINKILSGK